MEGATAEKIEAQEEVQAPQVKVAEEPERYYCIKLAPMKDKMDIPTPTITVGNKANKGPRLTIKRQTWIPVTSGYVEVFEQRTTYPVWQNVEGEDRKVPTYRTRFPLEGKIEITEEGYKELRRKVLMEKKELTEADIAQYRK